MYVLKDFLCSKQCANLVAAMVALGAYAIATIALPASAGNLSRPFNGAAGLPPAQTFSSPRTAYTPPNSPSAHNVPGLELGGTNPHGQGSHALVNPHGQGTYGVVGSQRSLSDTFNDVSK